MTSQIALAIANAAIAAAAAFPAACPEPVAAGA
jgi:hypothetical protein